jgi:hypothetical protein
VERGLDAQRSCCPPCPSSPMADDRRRERLGKPKTRRWTFSTPSWPQPVSIDSRGRRVPHAVSRAGARRERLADSERRPSMSGATTLLRSWRQDSPEARQTSGRIGCEPRSK